MQEADLERKVGEYAKSKGWLHYKFVSKSNLGVPDRIFLKDGNVFFIEFKGPRGKLSDLQTFKMREIHFKGGLDCFVVDNVEMGKKIIDGRS